MYGRGPCTMPKLTGSYLMAGFTNGLTTTLLRNTSRCSNQLSNNWYKPTNFRHQRRISFYRPRGYHVFICYQGSTRRTTLEDQLFQRVIAQPGTLRLTLTWLCHLSCVILKHTSRTLTMPLRSLELFNLPSMKPANASSIQWTPSTFKL